jgi:signal transduction histidine kinase
MDLETAILSSFRAGVVALRLDGTVAYINPIGIKILEGYALTEGDNIHLRAGENSFFRVLSESLATHYLPTRVEVELPRGDGDHQSLGFTLSELKSEGKKIGICTFFKDLTQVEMAEESEDLKQRLVLLGQMAAGLAHEIRNPLASIGVHCSILKSHLSQNEKLHTSVEMMGREIEKVEYIIRECLNFVRPADLGIRKVRVENVVGAVIERFQALNAEMDFSIKRQEEAEYLAEVDPGLIEQAITNIVSNAVDACEGKGKVEITFGIIRHFSDLIRLGRRRDSLVQGHSGNEEEFVRIAIRDNGPGISPEIKEKIFVPFYTTKKTGTGVGLPLAQKIIHAHGGVLDLVSEPGKGSDFIIKIPVRQEWRKES